MPDNDHDDEENPLGSRGDLDARLRRAVLEGAGTVGYSDLTVQHVLDRAEVSRSAFYRRFDDKDQCFAAAYKAALDQLGERLRTVCGAAGGWRQGLEAGLDAVGAFLVAEPLLANAVVVQARIAGGEAGKVREEALERLTRAVDGARAQTAEGVSPPPLAATFVLSSIEEVAVSALSRGVPNDFAAAIPSLTFLAVATYFGRDVAAEGEDGD